MAAHATPERTKRMTRRARQCRPCLPSLYFHFLTLVSSPRILVGWKWEILPRPSLCLCSNLKALVKHAILFLICSRDSSSHTTKRFGSGIANTQKRFARRAENNRPNHDGVKEKPTVSSPSPPPARRRSGFAEAPTQLPPPREN